MTLLEQLYNLKNLETKAINAKNKYDSQCKYIMKNTDTYRFEENVKKKNENKTMTSSIVAGVVAGIIATIIMFNITELGFDGILDFIGSILQIVVNIAVGVFAGAVVGYIVYIILCIIILNKKNKKVIRKKIENSVKNWEENNQKAFQLRNQYFREWNDAYNLYLKNNFLGNEVKYLNEIINKIASKRADTIKEALQLIDIDIANNTMQRIVQSELERQTEAIRKIRINNNYTVNNTFNYNQTNNIDIDVH